MHCSTFKRPGNHSLLSKKSGQEIDFIWNGNTALEVKETPIQQDKQTVKQRAADIDTKKSFVIGRNPSVSGFTDFIWAGNIF
jgi:hypothetical protein